MGAFSVVALQPFVEVSLQLGDREVDLGSEYDLVKLIQDRRVEALTDPIADAVYWSSCA